MLISCIAYANTDLNQPLPMASEGHYISLQQNTQQIQTAPKHPFGITPLMKAVHENNYNAVLSELNNGENINDQDTGGVTALHLAVSNNLKDITLLLLQKGALINHQTSQGLTPLMYAASNAHSDIVKMLIDYGADPDIVGVEGKTALDYAIQANDLKSIEYITSKIQRLSQQQINHSIQYAKQSPIANQSLALIQHATEPQGNPVSNNNSSVAPSHSSSYPDSTDNLLNNKQENDHTNTSSLQQHRTKNKHVVKKGIKNLQAKANNNNYTNSYKDRPKEYYLLYLGAFINMEDANNYWAMLKARHRWLNNLAHNIAKEQFYKNKQTFYDLFIGAFASKKDAEQVCLILQQHNISTTALASKQLPKNMTIVTAKKIEQDISLAEQNKQRHVATTAKEEHHATASTNEATSKEASELMQQPLHYYVLNFGLFIDEQHAKQYWQSISKIEWLSALHNVYRTAIHNNIDKPVISLQAGAMIEQTLAKNMINILSSVGVRVKLATFGYLPGGMAVVDKEQLFKKFNYSDYYSDNKNTNRKTTIHSPEEPQKQHLRVDVKEAILLENQPADVILKKKKQNPEELLNFRIASYRTKYSAAIALTKAAKYFSIERHAIRTTPIKRALLYISVSNTSPNAVCNYFVDKGYNCTVFEKDAE